MGVGYKVLKNYMLPISGVVFAVSLVGAVLGFDVVGSLDRGAGASLRAPLTADWWLLVALVSAFAALIGGWYFGEQLWIRRKFEKLIGTDKRSDFVSSRKDLEDLARRLPDSYKPRIKEKEAQFAPSRRA